MKNVLVLVHDDPGQEARLRAALDLTIALSGHLSCADVTPLPTVADSMFGTAPTLLSDEAEQEARNKAAVEARLADEDVSWSWMDFCGEFGPSIREASKTADVIVLNRRLEGIVRPDMRDIASEVLTHSDALVLVVGEETGGVAFGDAAMVAWDGSETAMNALQRAVPLLALASLVTIFQAGRLPSNAVGIEEAAAYLSRHKISPKIEFGTSGESVADQIRETAERIEAGYCVMGAYGHGRLREAVLGGVTRDMLTIGKVPLLLGH